MKISYEAWDPRGAALNDVHRAEVICTEYRTAGYTLTLRQLYYQFVARGYIENTERSYKRLGSIVNKGRMAGLLDWSMIEDRTRNLASLAHWSNPTEIIDAVARQYREDLWSTQDVRVEVWVEKEALAGVVERIANRWDCPWFSCRGYVSQSELWGAGQRLGGYLADGKRVVILHLGDHDPSGIDMTRDITDRLKLFVQTDWAEEYELPLDTGDEYGDDSVIESMGEEVLKRRDGDELTYWEDLVEVRRIALNMDQVRQYEPPPNPAKMTDSRSGDYVRQFGRQSWELDALPPDVLASLVEDHVLGIIDIDRYNDAHDKQEHERETLTATSAHWTDVVALVTDPDGPDDPTSADE